MTTTNNNNSSHRQAPTSSNPYLGKKEVVIFFRQSSDGVNFTVTPVYLDSADAALAIHTSPAEYSLNNSTFAAWPGGYNNSAQAVGGRGRIQGACVAAD